MAASAAKSSTSASSEEILYDTLGFTEYFEKITTACLAKKDAAVVLGGVIKDPITNFRLYHIKRYGIKTTDSIKTDIKTAKAEEAKRRRSQAANSGNQNHLRCRLRRGK